LTRPDLYKNNNVAATQNVKETASKTIPGNIVSKVSDIEPIKKPSPAAKISHVFGAKCGLGLTIKPIKGIHRPNVIKLEIVAAKIPITVTKLINGLEKFHEIAAVDTKTASIIAVLFTAPSKVILSDPDDAEVLNADDLITGLPDFPKVSRAACFDIII
tara:strand:- start:269 stop:745 length:477 start_codon:yes stop_codon:yes gene_type:complete